MAWRCPTGNGLTPQARQVWAACFPREAWPTGWRVTWVGFMRNCYGLTKYGPREILLSHADARRHHRALVQKHGPVEILLHEFVHLRCGRRLRHGQEFLALENALRTRLGFEPLKDWRES